MICPHCEKEFKITPKPKPLFCIKIAHRRYFRVSDGIWPPECYHTESELEWKKPRHFDNSLRVIVQKFRSLKLDNNKYKAGCIAKCIDNKYIPGIIYDFPDGTIAWVPDPYLPKGSMYSKTVFEKLHKYWRFRIFEDYNDFEKSVVTCDPKAAMYFFRHLYVKKIKVPNIPCPPIYDKYLKLTPHAHIDPSEEWDPIINTTWTKPIREFINEFNVKDDDDWKQLYRTASHKY